MHNNKNIIKKFIRFYEENLIITVEIAKQKKPLSWLFLYHTYSAFTKIFNSAVTPFLKSIGILYEPNSLIG